MIRKKNIGLVVDTNILIDIINSSNGGFNSLTVNWIKEIIKDMSKQPKGKTITIFANTKILKEYKTGLCSNNHCKIGKTILLTFDKSLSSRLPVSKKDNIYLTLHKMPPPTTKQARLSDTDDDKFLILLEMIMNSPKWDDRDIIFASRDSTTIDQIQSILNKSDRIHFASSKWDLDRVIEC